MVSGWLVGKGVKSRRESLVRQVGDKGVGKREGRRVNRQHSGDIATRLTVNDDLDTGAGAIHSDLPGDPVLQGAGRVTAGRECRLDSGLESDGFHGFGFSGVGLAWSSSNCAKQERQKV
jgi:hypothetical protein